MWWSVLWLYNISRHWPEIWLLDLGLALDWINAALDMTGHDCRLPMIAWYIRYITYWIILAHLEHRTSTYLRTGFINDWLSQLSQLSKSLRVKEHVMYNAAYNALKQTSKSAEAEIDSNAGKTRLESSAAFQQRRWWTLCEIGCGKLSSARLRQNAVNQSNHNHNNLTAQTS